MDHKEALNRFFDVTNYVFEALQADEAARAQGFDAEHQLFVSATTQATFAMLATAMHEALDMGPAEMLVAMGFDKQDAEHRMRELAGVSDGLKRVLKSYAEKRQERAH